MTPVINPSRTISAALRSRVKEELDDMERKNVIRKVEKPTDWFISMVVVEKPNGKLRICLDPKHLNKAIKREHFQLPTIEDITTRMANAKWFSQLDANHGYWQIPLDKDSVETDIDDILIHGTTEEEHDRRLESVLERCEKINLTLNKEKCEFKSREITYVGHKLTENGGKPDERKVKAINEMEAPTDKNDKGLSSTVFVYFGIATKPISSVANRGFTSKLYLRKDGYSMAYASSSFTETESRYAEIEKELLGVQFNLDRFHQYVYGKEVYVELDHKSLEMIAKKSLALAPPRLQRLLLRKQKNGAARYVVKSPFETDEQMENEINLHNGWPDQRESVLLSVLPYWNIRDELSVIDGIILKGDRTRIVVPLAMRKDMLQRIHHGHMGIEKSKGSARDALYWPLMCKQIAEMVSKCTVCLEHRKESTKEPMIPFRVPTFPWEVVATDLFSLDNLDYLLIVDYLSRYFEVVKLPDTTSSTVITYTQSIFSQHGIPAEVSSQPTSNGLAERTVQTIKDLLVKSKKDQRDPYLSLLEYRNTPIDDVGSPAQLLMNRRLRSRFPQTISQLNPRIPDRVEVKTKLNLKQQKQKFYYDRQSKSITKLHERDRIRVRMKGSRKPGVVTREEETPRSYRVQIDDGGEYRRNRRMLLKSVEPDPVAEDMFSDEIPSTRIRSIPSLENVEALATLDETQSQSSTITEIIPPSTEVRTTSRGRIIKRPSRFNDFIMK
ncbi:Transposon Ty3-G Gag-Pol poly [Paramuricea clavata]|uniref:Transposon Ty3-G Gag-Pol poly n=1 Tax=Paramuricea clavata TaxID=317549 RepID=A0A6S7JBA8_PARCT|nr:Transposon Ty3-G Gag-Pol poly [Paramuricea clavata]